MGGNKFSLMNLDMKALSVPIAKLIETVQQCVGTLYEPTRIRRKAKAEADAAITLAKGEIEKQELLHKAAHRLAIQEIRRQENIERIIDNALESLPENVSDEPVDPDWVSRFFDECKDVSNEDLQVLWGRILAGEVTSPGSCSRKTLSILKDLSPKDADLFRRTCSLAWQTEDGFFLPVWLNVPQPLGKYEISYDDCLHLNALGLAHCSPNIVFSLKDEERIDYLSWRHICIYKGNREDTIADEIHGYPLSASGAELHHIVDTEPNWGFYTDSLQLIQESCRVILVCPIPGKD